MDAKEYWELLRKTGWLKSVPASQHTTLRRRVGRALKSGEPWKGLATGGYDVECIENEGDYVRLLDAYSEASYRRFKPTEVSDAIDFEDGTARIRLKIRGKRFVRRFEQDGDCVSDQIASLTFVRPDAFRKAVKAGLVPKPALEDEDDEDDGVELFPFRPHVDAAGKVLAGISRSDVEARA